MFQTWTEWKAQKEELQSLSEVIAKPAICLGYESSSEGIHLKIRTPDGRSGTTSALIPNKGIYSTNQPGENGGIVYVAKTVSGSHYTVEMTDNIAKDVLQAYYNPPGKQAQATIGAAQAAGTLRGGRKGSPKFIIDQPT